MPFCLTAVSLTSTSFLTSTCVFATQASHVLLSYDVEHDTLKSTGVSWSSLYIRDRMADAIATLEWKEMQQVLQLA